MDNFDVSKFQKANLSEQQVNKLNSAIDTQNRQIKEQNKKAAEEAARERATQQIAYERMNGDALAKQAANSPNGLRINYNDPSLPSRVNIGTKVNPHYVPTSALANPNVAEQYNRNQFRELPSVVKTATVYPEKLTQQKATPTVSTHDKDWARRQFETADDETKYKFGDADTYALYKYAWNDAQTKMYDDWFERVKAGDKILAENPEMAKKFSDGKSYIAYVDMTQEEKAEYNESYDKFVQAQDRLSSLNQQLVELQNEFTRKQQSQNDNSKAYFSADQFRYDTNEQYEAAISYLKKEMEAPQQYLYDAQNGEGAYSAEMKKAEELNVVVSDYQNNHKKIDEYALAAQATTSANERAYYRQLQAEAEAREKNYEELLREAGFEVDFGGKLKNVVTGATLQWGANMVEAVTAMAPAELQLVTQEYEDLVNQKRRYEALLSGYADADGNPSPGFESRYIDAQMQLDQVRSMLVEKETQKQALERTSRTYQKAVSWGELGAQKISDIQNKTKAGDILTQVGVAGTQMGLDFVTGALLGAGGIAAGLKAGQGVAAVTSGAKAMVPMMVRSYGGGIQEALDKGYSMPQAQLLGFASAGIEYVSEKLFGGNIVYDKGALAMNGAGKLVMEGGSGWVTKAVAALGANEKFVQLITSMPADILSEGLEEIVSDIFNPIAEWAISGGEAKPEYDINQIVEDGIVGVAMALAGMPAQIVGNSVNTIKEKHQQKIFSVYDAAIRGDQTGREVTDDDVKFIVNSATALKQLGIDKNLAPAAKETAVREALSNPLNLLKRLSVDNTQARANVQKAAEARQKAEEKQAKAAKKEAESAQRPAAAKAVVAPKKLDIAQTVTDVLAGNVPTPDVKPAATEAPKAPVSQTEKDAEIANAQAEYDRLNKLFKRNPKKYAEAREEARKALDAAKAQTTVAEEAPANDDDLPFALGDMANDLANKTPVAAPTQNETVGPTQTAANKIDYVPKAAFGKFESTYEQNDNGVTARLSVGASNEELFNRAFPEGLTASGATAEEAEINLHKKLDQVLGTRPTQFNNKALRGDNTSRIPREQQMEILSRLADEYGIDLIDEGGNIIKSDGKAAAEGTLGLSSGEFVGNKRPSTPETGKYAPTRVQIVVHSANENPLQMTFTHEMTHVLYNSGLLNDFYASVVEYCRSIGIDVDAEIAKIQLYYELNNVQTNDASGEFLAHFCGSGLFSTPDFVKAITTEKPTLASKIREFIDKVVDVVNSVLGNSDTSLKSLQNEWAKQWQIASEPVSKRLLENKKLRDRYDTLKQMRDERMQEQAMALSKLDMAASVKTKDEVNKIAQQMADTNGEMKQAAREFGAYAEDLTESQKAYARLEQNDYPQTADGHAQKATDTATVAKENFDMAQEELDNAKRNGEDTAKAEQALEEARKDVQKADTLAMAAEAVAANEEPTRPLTAAERRKAASERKRRAHGNNDVGEDASFHRAIDFSTNQKRAYYKKNIERNDYAKDFSLKRAWAAYRDAKNHPWDIETGKAMSIDQIRVAYGWDFSDLENSGPHFVGKTKGDGISTAVDTPSGELDNLATTYGKVASQSVRYDSLDIAKRMEREGYTKAQIESITGWLRSSGVNRYGALRIGDEIAALEKQIAEIKAWEEKNPENASTYNLEEKVKLYAEFQALAEILYGIDNGKIGVGDTVPTTKFFRKYFRGLLTGTRSQAIERNQSGKRSESAILQDVANISIADELTAEDVSLDNYVDYVNQHEDDDVETLRSAREDYLREGKTEEEKELPEIRAKMKNYNISRPTENEALREKTDVTRDLLGDYEAQTALDGTTDGGGVVNDSMSGLEDRTSNDFWYDYLHKIGRDRFNVENAEALSKLIYDLYSNDTTTFADIHVRSAKELADVRNQIEDRLTEIAQNENFVSDKSDILSIEVKRKPVYYAEKKLEVLKEAQEAFDHISGSMSAEERNAAFGEHSDYLFNTTSDDKEVADLQNSLNYYNSRLVELREDLNGTNVELGIRGSLVDMAMLNNLLSDERTQALDALENQPERQTIYTAKVGTRLELMPENNYDGLLSGEAVEVEDQWSPYIGKHIGDEVYIGNARYTITNMSNADVEITDNTLELQNIVNARQRQERLALEELAEIDLDAAVEEGRLSEANAAEISDLLRKYKKKRVEQYVLSSMAKRTLNRIRNVSRGTWVSEDINNVAAFNQPYDSYNTWRGNRSTSQHDRDASAIMSTEDIAQSDFRFFHDLFRLDLNRLAYVEQQYQAWEKAHNQKNPYENDLQRAKALQAYREDYLAKFPNRESPVEDQSAELADKQAKYDEWAKQNEYVENPYAEDHELWLMRDLITVVAFEADRSNFKSGELGKANNGSQIEADDYFDPFTGGQVGFRDLSVRQKAEAIRAGVSGEEMGLSNLRRDLEPFDVESLRAYLQQEQESIAEILKFTRFTEYLGNVQDQINALMEKDYESGDNANAEKIAQLKQLEEQLTGQYKAMITAPYQLLEDMLTGRFDAKSVTDAVPIAAVLKHPAIFAAVPEISDWKVKFSTLGYGESYSVNSKDKILYLNKNDTAKNIHASLVEFADLMELASENAKSIDSVLKKSAKDFTKLAENYAAKTERGETQDIININEWFSKNKEELRAKGINVPENFDFFTFWDSLNSKQKDIVENTRGFFEINRAIDRAQKALKNGERSLAESTVASDQSAALQNANLSQYGYSYMQQMKFLPGEQRFAAITNKIMSLLERGKTASLRQSMAEIGNRLLNTRYSKDGKPVSDEEFAKAKAEAEIELRTIYKGLFDAKNFILTRQQFDALKTEDAKELTVRGSRMDALAMDSLSKLYSPERAEEYRRKYFQQEQPKSMVAEFNDYFDYLYYVAGTVDERKQIGLFSKKNDKSNLYGTYRLGQFVDALLQDASVAAGRDVDLADIAIQYATLHAPQGAMDVSSKTKSAANTYVVTQAFYDGFKKYIDTLKQISKENTEAIKEGRAQGDLSENAEYHAAREAKALTTGQLNSLEAIFNGLKVGKADGSQPIMGSLVTLRNANGDEIQAVLGTPDIIDVSKVNVLSPDAVSGKLEPKSKVTLVQLVEDPITHEQTYENVEYEVASVDYDYSDANIFQMPLAEAASEETKKQTSGDTYSAPVNAPLNYANERKATIDNGLYDVGMEDYVAARNNAIDFYSEHYVRPTGIISDFEADYTNFAKMRNIALANLEQGFADFVTQNGMTDYGYLTVDGEAYLKAQKTAAQNAWLSQKELNELLLGEASEASLWNAETALNRATASQIKADKAAEGKPTSVVEFFETLSDEMYSFMKQSPEGRALIATYYEYVDANHVVEEQAPLFNMVRAAYLQSMQSNKPFTDAQFSAMAADYYYGLIQDAVDSMYKDAETEFDVDYRRYPIAFMKKAQQDVFSLESQIAAEYGVPVELYDIYTSFADMSAPMSDVSTNPYDRLRMECREIYNLMDKTAYADFLAASNMNNAELVSWLTDFITSEDPNVVAYYDEILNNEEATKILDEIEMDLDLTDEESQMAEYGEDADVGEDAMFSTDFRWNQILQDEVEKTPLPNLRLGDLDPYVREKMKMLDGMDTDAVNMQYGIALGTLQSNFGDQPNLKNADGVTLKDDTYATLMAIYNLDVQEQNWQDAMNILYHLQRHNGDGNVLISLQIADIFNSMTPTMRTEIMRQNVRSIEYTVEQKYGVQDYHFKIADSLYADYQKAVESGNDKAIEKAANAIERSVARQIPKTMTDKLSNFRYTAMLLNPKTHIRNVLSNVMFGALWGVKNEVAAATEVVMQATGLISKDNRTRGFGILSNGLLAECLKDFSGAVRETYRHGGKWKETGTDFFAAGGLLGSANNQFLDAEDVASALPAYAMRLAQYIRAKGYKSLSDLSEAELQDAREVAIKDAQRATFRDHNEVSNVASRASKAPQRLRANATTQIGRDVGMVGDILVQSTVPFVRTPANMLMRAYEFSPLAFRELRNKDLSSAEKADVFASALLGTMLQIGGGVLASAGLLKGSGRDDEDEDTYNSMRGIQKYAWQMKNRDVTISLDDFAPFIVPLMIGANIWEIASRQNADGFNPNSFVDYAIKPFIEMTGLSNFESLLTDISYLDMNSEDWTSQLFGSIMTSYMAQFVPTLWTNTMKLFDDVQMSTRVDKARAKAIMENDDGSAKAAAQKLIQTVKNVSQYGFANLENKIAPFASNSRIENVDLWGRTKSTSLNNFTGETSFVAKLWNGLVNPTDIRSVSNTEIDQELARLADAGLEIYPEKVKNSQQVDKQLLTNAEAEKYAKVIGSERLRLVDEAIHSDAYKALDSLDDQEYADQKKQELIQACYNQAALVAANAVRKMRGEQEKLTENEQLVGKMSDADFITYVLTKDLIGNIGGQKADSNDVELYDLLTGNKPLKEVFTEPMSDTDAKTAERLAILDGTKISTEEFNEVWNPLYKQLTKAETEDLTSNKADEFARKIADYYPIGSQEYEALVQAFNFTTGTSLYKEITEDEYYADGTLRKAGNTYHTDYEKFYDKLSQYKADGNYSDDDMRDYALKVAGAKIGENTLANKARAYAGLDIPTEFKVQIMADNVSSAENYQEKFYDAFDDAALRKKYKSDEDMLNLIATYYEIARYADQTKLDVEDVCEQYDMDYHTFKRLDRKLD